jgi:hypothetical protein
MKNNSTLPKKKKSLSRLHNKVTETSCSLWYQQCWPEKFSGIACSFWHTATNNQQWQIKGAWLCCPSTANKQTAIICHRLNKCQICQDTRMWRKRWTSNKPRTGSRVEQMNKRIAVKTGFDSVTQFQLPSCPWCKKGWQQRWNWSCSHSWMRNINTGANSRTIHAYVQGLDCKRTK